MVFLLIGGFLGLAALHASSSEAHGLGGALQALQQQPYGWVLLALTALGLLAFGLFGLVQARYRHIDAPDLDDAKAAVARMGQIGQDFWKGLAIPGRLELPTFGLGNRCSVLLSYGTA